MKNEMKHLLFFLDLENVAFFAFSLCFLRFLAKKILFCAKNLDSQQRNLVLYFKKFIAYVMRS